MSRIGIWPLKHPSWAAWKSQEGFVLLSVLIVTTLISALTIGIATGIRARLRTADAEIELTINRSLADAGVVRIIAALEAVEDPLLNDLRNAPALWTYDKQEITLSLQSEAGKVDLNAGHPELVRSVMQAVVRDGGLAERILDRWSALRENGHVIESVDRLLDFREKFTSAASDLETYFTTFSGAKGVDPLAAPDLVLRHIPGLTESDLLSLYRQRESSGDQRELAAIKQRYYPFFEGERPLFRIMAMLMRPDQTRMRREALVTQDIQTRQIRVIFWRNHLSLSSDRAPVTGAGRLP